MARYVRQESPRKSRNSFREHVHANWSETARGPTVSSNFIALHFASRFRFPRLTLSKIIKSIVSNVLDILVLFLIEIERKGEKTNTML